MEKALNNKTADTSIDMNEIMSPNFSKIQQ